MPLPPIEPFIHGRNRFRSGDTVEGPAPDGPVEAGLPPHEPDYHPGSGRTTHLESTMTTPVNVCVLYYSSTGTTHAMAEWQSQAAEKAGADVRLRKVAELAPEKAIRSDADWVRHREETQDIPVPTPRRRGLVRRRTPRLPDAVRQRRRPAQAVPRRPRPQWAQGQLADKVYAGLCTWLGG